MKGFPKNRYYMNIDTGELLTYNQMVKQAAEEYDLDDFTNALELWEIYDLTDLIVEKSPHLMMAI